jgi:DNA-binding IclR family transcriptional regulator
MEKRVVQYDKYTGEQLEGVLVHVSPKRKNGYAMWIAMNQECLDALCSPELTGYDRRVLLALACLAGNDNQIMITQKKLADRLGIAATHISRSIANLVKRGFLIKGEKIGGLQMLSLHIEYFWRGDSRKHKDLMHEYNLESMRAARKKAA